MLILFTKEPQTRKGPLSYHVEKRSRRPYTSLEALPALRLTLPSAQGSARFLFIFCMIVRSSHLQVLVTPCSSSRALPYNCCLSKRPTLQRRTLRLAIQDVLQNSRLPASATRTVPGPRSRGTRGWGFRVYRGIRACGSGFIGVQGTRAWGFRVYRV